MKNYSSNSAVPIKDTLIITVSRRKEEYYLNFSVRNPPMLLKLSVTNQVQEIPTLEAKRRRVTLFSHIRGNSTCSELPSPKYCIFADDKVEHVVPASWNEFPSSLSTYRCQGNNSWVFWNAIPIKSSMTFYASFLSISYVPKHIRRLWFKITSRDLEYLTKRRVPFDQIKIRFATSFSLRGTAFDRRYTKQLKIY